MRDEMKPCECGNEKLYVAFVMNELYQVHCQKCGKSAPMGYTQNGAIDQWNKQEGSNA